MTVAGNLLLITSISGISLWTGDRYVKAPFGDVCLALGGNTAHFHILLNSGQTGTAVMTEAWSTSLLGET